MTKNVLVIKLGALGDFVQATGPFAAIRRHHADARVVLLTTRPFVDFAAESPWFDEVWVDSRPKWWNPAGWLALRERLHSGDFERVYDLQTSQRSSSYFRLMGPGRRPDWSGIAAGCSLPHANPSRDGMHTLERQAEQLRLAGIATVPPPDLSWAEADLGRFDLPRRFALLVPGGSGHRPEKRWPAARFAELAGRLARSGLEPLVVGGVEEAPLARAIPAARDLAGQTSLVELAALGRRAAVAVGNDTGPMHVLAVAGAPSLVLFSAASRPELCAPRGRRVTVLRRERLDELPVDEVLREVHAACAA